MLKIVSNVFHSLTNVINCIVYFSLFTTSFYFGYLFWYLYLYFYVADVIIKFITIPKKKMKGNNIFQANSPRLRVLIKSRLSISLTQRAVQELKS